MSIVVTCHDTETGETSTVTLQPGQFVVCCAEPAHVVSDIAYANGKNNVWVKRNRDEPPVKVYKRPRGTCTVCATERSLNGHGGLQGHDNPRKPGTTGWPGRCPGSYLAPRAVSGSGEATTTADGEP